MALSRTHEALLRVSRADNKLLTALREGVYLERSTSRTVDDLRDQACADRVEFAETFVRSGDKMMRSRPVLYRDAISRYYYAMYHGMRAVVFFVNDGDDHQRHEVLPKHTPRDFPDAALWENAVKNARAYRNEADYDPYPVQISNPRQVAMTLQSDAHAFMPLVRAYLQGKGCRHA